MNDDQKERLREAIHDLRHCAWTSLAIGSFCFGFSFLLDTCLVKQLMLAVSFLMAIVGIAALIYADRSEP